MAAPSADIATRTSSRLCGSPGSWPIAVATIARIGPECEVATTSSGRSAASAPNVATARHSRNAASCGGSKNSVGLRSQYSIGPPCAATAR